MKIPEPWCKVLTIVEGEDGKRQYQLDVHSGYRWVEAHAWDLKVVGWIYLPSIEEVIRLTKDGRND